MKTFILRALPHPSRSNCIQAIKEAPDGYEVRVKEGTRSGEQNSLLHALLTEISKEREWAGEKRDVETWKRLMVAAWLRTRGEALQMLPAIDGKGFDIVYSPTSKMTRSEVSELVEYIFAWKATTE